MGTTTDHQKVRIRSFKDLHSWQVAHELVLHVYSSTQEFPRAEQFSLTDQLRRASVSITSNIAEGFSRGSAKEKRQFYRSALASLTEVQNQLLIARDVGYLSGQSFLQIQSQTERVQQLLQGLIKSAPTIRNT